MDKQNDKAELAHYGILGMKWGVRRYQNPDGSLTAAGKARYNTGETRGSRTSTENKSSSIRSSISSRWDSAKEQREARKAEQAKTDYEKKRQKALTATDPAEIAKYSRYLTDEEIQTRINRTRKERELTDLYSQQRETKYFDSHKALGQAAMTTVTGIGNGGSELAKSATIYLGKQAIKSVFGDEVYKEMFPTKDKKKDKDKD